MEGAQANTKEKVLITGVTGFLGNHVCKLFLEDGTYKVRGSTTNPQNKSKRDGLRQACGDYLFDKELELVKANLTDPQSVDKAVEGCQYVVHVASPCPAHMPSKSEEDLLIRTAVQGTLHVLRAATKHKVKRVVLTSSTAAVIDRANQTAGRIITEKDWAHEDTTENSYSKSKILQEKAAWKYWNSLPEEGRFEMVVLNPGNLFGPAFKKEEFASANIIRAIVFWSRLFGFPKIYYQVVDVRDAALAHLRALKVPEARNQRFLIVGEGMYWIMFGKYLHEEFGKHYYITTTRIRTEYILDAFAYFTRKAVLLAAKRGPEQHCQTDKSSEILGLKYRPGKQSLVEMTYWMIDVGYIPNKLPAALQQKRKSVANFDDRPRL